MKSKYYYLKYTLYSIFLIIYYILPCYGILILFTLTQLISKHFGRLVLVSMTLQNAYII